MSQISKETLDYLRERYPKGARVELVKMEDRFNKKLAPGCRGTVRAVDDIGTIHVAWDCGSSLGVVYGKDECKLLDSVTTICYGKRKVWDSREEAIREFIAAMASVEGSQRDRYTNVYINLMSGLSVCGDGTDDEEQLKP